MFEIAKDRILSSYRTKIRERAIVLAKKRLAFEDRRPQEVPQDELEAIVAEEEMKLKAQLKGLGIGALISALAFGTF